MTALEFVNHALSASSSAPDPTLRTLYLASARATINEVREELDAAERLVAAQEAELVRVAKVQR